MALGARREAVLTVSRYDKTTDKDKTYTYHLHNVSIQANSVMHTAQTGLVPSSLYKVRVFADTTVLSDDGTPLTYADPATWNTLSNPTGRWTVFEGATLTIGATKATVLGVHDNREGRFAPHIYLEAR